MKAVIRLFPAALFFAAASLSCRAGDLAEYMALHHNFQRSPALKQKIKNTVMHIAQDEANNSGVDKSWLLENNGEQYAKSALQTMAFYCESQPLEKSAAFDRLFNQRNCEVILQEIEKDR